MMGTNICCLQSPPMVIARSILPCKNVFSCCSLRRIRWLCLCIQTGTSTKESTISAYSSCRRHTCFSATVTALSVFSLEGEEEVCLCKKCFSSIFHLRSFLGHGLASCRQPSRRSRAHVNPMLSKLQILSKPSRLYQRGFVVTEEQTPKETN